MPRAQNHAGRILRPAVRRGWLEGGGGAARGRDAFVEVGWDEALDLAARELARVKAEHGNASHLRRLLRLGERGPLPPPAGPAAPLPQLPRRLHRVGQQLQLRGHGGHPAARHRRRVRRDLLLGAALGRDRGAHRADRRVRRPGAQEHADQLGRPRAARGARAPSWPRARPASTSSTSAPCAATSTSAQGARWIAPRPEHRRRADDGPRALDDRRRHATTATSCATAARAGTSSRRTSRARATACGATPPGRAAICDVEASAIEALAAEMTARRTLVTVSWSLQRADHGEQPFWMGVALAAMTGSMGLPGRRLRLRLRRDPLGRPAARPPPHHGAARRAANAVTTSDAGRAHRRRAARARAGDRLQRPAHHASRTSASSTGAAAIRSTTTRT